MQRKENTLCRLHTLRAIQLGSCITCRSASPICETKGCIKHHLESEKMHTSYTVREIQKITDQYTSSNEEKRNILLKMVNEYFQALKAEIEALYHEATHAIENLRFENYLLSEKQRKLAELLVTRRYSELLCEDVAAIIPKMLKVASFEEKQFNYLKDFLVSEREGLNKTVNTLVLNLPYFRDDQSVVSLEKFTVVAEEKLNNVNARLQALSFRPRKLRIMYSKSLPMQAMTTQLMRYAGYRTLAYKLMRFRGKVHSLAGNERAAEGSGGSGVLLHVEHQRGRLPDRVHGRSSVPALSLLLHHLHRIQDDLHRLHRGDDGEQEHRDEGLPQGVALLITSTASHQPYHPFPLNISYLLYCRFQSGFLFGIRQSLNHRQDMPRKNISKVVVIGDSAVGKTSLLTAFTEDKFVRAYKATIGADFTQKSLIVDGKEVVMEIWDTAGQERFKSLGTSFYRGADCCMIVYDITSAKSFAGIQSWMNEFLQYGSPREPGTFPFVVVGNKMDLEGQREVEAQAIRELHQRHPRIVHCQTSAKDKTGVGQVFERAARASLENKPEEIVFNVYEVNSTKITNIGKQDRRIRKTCCN